VANSPHDALFRFTFGQPQHAAALLRHVLPAALVRAIDWSSLVLQAGTQIDKRLRRQQSDLLFAVRSRDGPALIYVLIEHKSRRDPWTALQLLSYVVGIWQAQRRRRDGARLPRILPVLLHHGRRPWTAATDVAELLDRRGVSSAASALLQPWQPRFQHLVVSTAAWGPDQLRSMALTLLGKVTLAALQFLPGASHRQVVEAIVRWADLVRQLLRAPSGREALEALSTYVLTTTAVEPDRLLEVVERAVESGASVTMKTMKTAAARLRAEGRAEGKAEGKAQGKAEGKAELLLRLLTTRFGAVDEQTRAVVCAATSEQLDQWAVLCLEAPTLAEVFSSR